MRIRKATMQDAAELARLMISFSEENRRRVFTPLVADVNAYTDLPSCREQRVGEYVIDRLVYMAEQDRIIGYICAHISEERAHRKRWRAELDEWFVERDARRAGVGRALYEALLAEVKRQGCSVIHLHVYKDNRAARKLYSRLGFEETALALTERL